jgi:SNF2 family DNA or RNA helicase
MNEIKINQPLEIRALDVLDNYSGANNYIIKLKIKKDTNKKFYPTRNQAEYILSYKDTTPKIARKWVELDMYFANKLADEKLLTEVPTKIWVEKLLVEKDTSYHIWGKFNEHEELYNFWIPKSGIIKDNSIKVNIDYEKYSHRPPLSHQIEGIEKLVGNKKYILADDMGLGKTTQAIIAALETGVDKILIISPASLKINWQREIENYTDRSVAIIDGKKWESADFVIVNYDILKNFHDPKNRENSQILNEGFGLVVLDECFTYDTKIITEFGEKNIGDIVENGLDVKILTFNHKNNIFEYKKINRWIRKNKDTIYKIKLNNGRFIECTDNHKFYVNNKGYVKAKDLTSTDDLYMLSKTTFKETNLEEGKMLFKELFINNKEQNISTKTKGIEFVRVESIEILERGSYDKSTNVYSKNTRVYDLEIEDNHNYFANNILVSNCHYIQNTQAQRTKLINDFVKKIDRLWLLTGTPITSRPINYYNLLNLIDSPVAMNWMAYVIRYCEGYQFSVGKRKIWNVSGASNLEELRDRTSRQVLRRLKTDVLDLPEKIITPVYLKLKSYEYERLMGEYYDWYDKSEESTSLTVQFTKLMKVRQVVSEEKVKSTIELCENIIEQGKKVIVFTNFTNSLNTILSHFGKKAVGLDGSMPQGMRQDNVDKFQNDESIMVFVGNIKAAGVGITLTSAEVVVMNDLSFVPSDHSQAEDRAYRYGQKNNVLVYYPIFDNTIEGIIYNILQKKKNIFETVMGDNLSKGDFVEEIMTLINTRR